MTLTHLEVLVEELSMERALGHLLPKIVPNTSFSVRTFQGKPNLIKQLPSRLAGYRQWSGSVDMGIVVIVDQDDDDCRDLLARLDQIGSAAGFATASVSRAASGRLLNRIVIEELEAWFFGDVPALRAAYPGVPVTLADRAGFRDPDSIAGGTAEALARVLSRAGHHRGGLRKVAAADDIARHLDVETNRSTSFQKFRDGVRFLVEGAA